ncbi:EAL domain-containing protein, partial [Bacillus sp. IG2]|uniref:EAL domain-containing protein n=1 Tax=Bacillus sp. IG2 TaxID=3075931 RepID=UPI0028F7EA0E
CLSNKGHPIYIDDFGTGYSSLAYLGRFRIDAVKIDRSFTQATSKESAMPSILPQILSIAKKFQLSAVVEGIEHAEQASYLQNLDRFIYGQGWHYGKPHNAAFAIALLKNDLPHAACHGSSMSGLQPLR